MDKFLSYWEKYRYKTCVIIGNGPSLNKVPESFLRKYPTFGSNKIFMRFTPSFYVAVNPLVIAQNMVDIAALDCVKFIAGEHEGDDIICLKSNPAPMFSYNPRGFIYEGHTVTFVSLQLAFYMGFKVALLVGVDHRYEFNGEPNEELLMEGPDPNHFDPDYFRGQLWNAPDLEKSEQAYQLAKKAYESNGRRIINLTPNSALEVFEKGNLRSWK